MIGLYFFSGFYIVFAYLFMLGAKLDNENMPNWNVWFAPLVLPLALGNMASIITRK